MGERSQFSTDRLDLGSVSVPVDGTAGYPQGSVIFRGVAPFKGLYVNQGSISSCRFVRSSTLAAADEWAVVNAEIIAGTSGVTAFRGKTRFPLLETDLAFMEYCTSDDSDQVKLANVIAGTIGGTIVDPLSAHTLSCVSLRAGGPANYEVFAAGTFTTAGGDAAESITVAGCLASDVCLVQLQTVGASPVTLDEAICVAGAITLECSADPGTDHVYNYVVFRAAGSFKPSHYIVAAGSYSCLTADGVAMAVPVTGALTTDVAFAGISTADDATDVLVTVKPTAAGVLTITSSNDPGTDGTHVFDYFLVRANP